MNVGPIVGDQADSGNAPAPLLGEPERSALPISPEIMSRVFNDHVHLCRKCDGLTLCEMGDLLDQLVSTMAALRLMDAIR